MKRILLQIGNPLFTLGFAALFAAGLLVVPADVQAAKVASSNPLSGDEQAIQEGKTLYRAVCVVCHGMRANGRGRGIAGASNLQKFKRGYTLYVDIVKNGKKKMPPYGGGRVLSDAEIDQIGAYLETLAVRGAVWIDPQ